MAAHFGVPRTPFLTTASASFPRPFRFNEDGGLPPLIVAARDGDIPTLKRVLAAPNIKTTINTTTDSKGQTALHHALNGACVLLLCRAGADVFIQDSLGNTPLHAATERHCSGAVRELLSIAEGSASDAANARCINVQNMMGETALHIAVKGQNKPICTLLCSYKPDFTLVNHFGQTPLHLAAKDDDLELVEMLVREGANPNAHDSLGMTALHVAVINDNPDFKICRVLIENGADVNAVDNNGRKPVDLARMRKLDQKVQFLESQGGNIVPLYFARKADTIDDSKWIPPYARKHQNKKLKKLGLDLSVGDEHNIDRWGFEIPPDMDEAKRTEVTVTKESDMKVEIRRTGKWEVMTASKEVWEKWMKRSQAKVRERCYKGIPPAVRGRAWTLLSGADRMKAQYGNDYYKNLLCEQSPSLGQIDMDIHRTYRNHEMFRTRYGNGQRMLFNILRAYSVYDKDVGYCQGMAEIAAILLMFMPEEDAFWVLVQLLAAPKYALRELYLPGFAALHTHFHVHTRLVQETVPKLYAHFEQIGMKTVFYATKWYSTLFNGVLPFEHTVRVWDIVMIEGTEILYTIAVRTLEAQQRRYLELGFAEAMPLLLTLKDVITEPPNEYIATATHRPFIHAFIDTFRLEYAKQQFQNNRDDSDIPDPLPVSPSVASKVASQHTSSEDAFCRPVSVGHQSPEQASSQPPPQQKWQGGVLPKSEHGDFINMSFKRRRNSLLRDNRSTSALKTPSNTPASVAYPSPTPFAVQPDPTYISSSGSLVSFVAVSRSKPIPVTLSPQNERINPGRQGRLSRSLTQSSVPVFHKLPPSGIPAEAESILGSSLQTTPNHM